MRRIGLVAFAALVALAGTVAGPRGALGQEPAIDPAFSDTRLSSLGYPEITIAVSEAGVEAPATLAAGVYYVTLTVSTGNSAYVDFMQPPPGLSPEEMTQQALDAAANDLVRPGWGFAGGGNTFAPGVPATFLIELAPGDYQIAASYYPELAAEEEYDITDEIMRLSPLTVTDGAATPSAATPVSAGATGATPAAGTPSGPPTADVTLEMTDDLRYIVSPDPVPAGPRIWEMTNTGTMHSHHMVMWRIPDGTTADQIIADFAGLFSGTPPAGPPLFTTFTGVAYAALQSGGRTTWNEFDLDPGTYAVICYIADVESGVPHLLDGMVTVFTVA